MPLCSVVRSGNVVWYFAAVVGQIIQKNVVPGSLQRFGNDDRGAIMIIDAGSTGSKVFAFQPAKLQAKLLTECTEAHKAAGRTLKGVAALAYNKSECEWQIGTDHLAPLAQETDYASALLKLLSDTYRSGPGASNLEDVENAEEVPMLATAGMRLVSQTGNSKVWGYLCGRTGFGLKLAPVGEKCGTIPGTTEAYYEFLANAARGRGNRTLTGTFTIGGASAQIAIPLRTDADVAAFEALKTNIARELDCRQLVLSDGHKAPIFNTRREGGPRTECIDDYIAFRPSRMIKATAVVLHEYVRIHDIRGLGLISFLGLKGRGSFVAGGANEVERWATEAGCDTAGEDDFVTCVQKLRAALASDTMWKHVTEYFKANALNINSFSYNTHNARPESAGFPASKVSGRDSAWELEQELQHKCGSDDSVRFGYKESNTCMRALFTAMYVTSFFSRDGSGGHSLSELYFDPHRDWAEGKLEEVQSFFQASTNAEMEYLRSLLKVPLSWHDALYTEGARIHLAVPRARKPRVRLRSNSLGPAA